MSENSIPSQDRKPQKPIQILRRRRGGVPKDLMEQNRRQKKLQKKLVEGLKDEPKTVPELAQITGIPTHDVLWHLMCMKKYGKIFEGEERDSYCEYGLIKEQEEKK